MSFDNEHPNRKDKRKVYTKRAQRHLRSCRSGGSCPYCQSGRKHAAKRRAPADVKEQLDSPERSW